MEEEHKTPQPPAIGSIDVALNIPLDLHEVLRSAARSMIIEANAGAANRERLVADAETLHVLADQVEVKTTANTILRMTAIYTIAARPQWLGFDDFVITDRRHNTQVIISKDEWQALAFMPEHRLHYAISSRYQFHPQ